MTQEIPDEKNYKHGLCHSFYARINWELNEISDFTVSLRGFSFFGTSLQRNSAKVIPNLFDSLEKQLLALNHSAFNSMKSWLIIFSMSPKVTSE